MNIFDLDEQYKLKYSFDFLEPIISAKQMQIHYEKHLLKYYENLKQIVQEHDASIIEMSKDLTELVKFCFGKQNLLHVHFNAGQIINHILYFESFVDNAIDKNIISKVKDVYGSADNFVKESLIMAKNNALGSTWLWLVYDNNSSVRLFVTPNAFTIYNLDFVDTVICCIDLWEHAYYLDYNEKRSDYLDNILKMTNLYKQI